MLLGNTTEYFLDGKAVFDNLVITKPGNSYSLEFKVEDPFSVPILDAQLQKSFK